MRQMLISWAATSCFLILAVVALRAAFGKRMGAGLRYALWGLVLLRLLVPVQLFTSPVLGTVIRSGENYTRIERETLDALGGQDGPQVTATAAPVFPAAPAMPAPPEAPEPPDLTKLAPVLGRVWLAGGAVMALVLAGCNLRFWMRLKRTRKLLDIQRADDIRPYTAPPVYVAEGLPSPCLFGVLRPAVYVSPETAADPEALRHVLAHEGTHFRHGDHIWSLLRCAALCVHWWNPLVWLAARLSRRDGELACDEGALRRLGDGERAAYGKTLLALVTAKPAPGGLLTCSTAMTGDKKSLTERFSRIARAPKRVVGFAVAAVLLAALVTVCAFGQKTEDAAPWEELEADLSLTVEADGTVRITGTVDGTELPRGAFWWPDDYLFSESPYGELFLVYPPFTDGIAGHTSAWWTDESRTAVNLSTEMAAMCSSYWPSGYWDFTVDFSGGEAVITKMEAIADFPEGMEVCMHPKTISDEDAIRVGRIAAKLLTAAEECREDWEEKGGVPVNTPEPSEPPAPSEAPPYVRDTGDEVSDRLALVCQGREKPFEALWKHFSTDDICEGTVVDLNGDGRDEVVVILNEGGGTGAAMSQPHIFDAETLEKYDTSWYRDAFLAYISSDSDEENYYLYACGQGLAAVSKSGLSDPSKAAASIGFGTWVEYDIQNGKLCCTLVGFGGAIEPVGTLSAVVELDLDPDTMSIGYDYRDFSFEPAEGLEVLPEPGSDGSAVSSTVPPPAQKLWEMTELPYHPDLNRNGVPETLLVGYYYESMDKDWSFPGVGVWEDGELLWTSIREEIAGTKTAYLLTEWEDGDYLMECSVWAGDGRCAYTYLGYDLRPLGQQRVFNGDTHFVYARGEYDEHAIEINEDDIASFMENANDLLSRSVVLYSSGEVFADPENPRLELSWLEHFAAGFTWDRSAPDRENLTRFEEAANRPNLAPAPVDPARARTELKQALLGQREFVYYSGEYPDRAIVPAVTVDINSAPQTAFLVSKDYGEIWSFAVLDLDGDGNEEVVLHIGDVGADMGGYLILRWAGPEDIRAYPSYWRNFWYLKTDGTFCYDYYTGVNGVARVSFPAPGYAMEQHALAEAHLKTGGSEPYDGTFTVDGESVTYEEYKAAWDGQDEKPDAEWYEFTQENVKKVLG